MNWNIFSLLVSAIRRHLFLTRYLDFNSNTSGTTIHYTGHAMGAMGAMAGKNVGNTLACAIFAAKKQMPHNFRINIAKYGGIAALIFISIFVMPESVQLIYLQIVSAIFLLISIIGGVIFMISLVVGMYLGWRDYRKYKKLWKLVNKGSPQDTDDLLSHLSDRHPETRHTALLALHNICKDSPGKLLKHTTHDRESLASTLVGHLSETDEDILQTCSSTIKWLARDHGEMFVSHSKTIAQHIESPHATVQTNIAIALGNIAQFDHEHSSAYAKALAPAAKDLDSEVRKAAAATLGKIPCSESVTILEYLVDNETAPDVAQEARNSLKQLRTQTTA